MHGDDAAVRQMPASRPAAGKLDVTIRKARREDIAAIVGMLAADDIGGHSDTLDEAAMAEYKRAFGEIAASAHQGLYVAECAGEVVGTFQTVLSRTLTGRGAATMTLRAVQTRSDCRGRGIGSAMVLFAVREAQRQGIRLVDLGSNAARRDAHRFYERLGFVASHIGFKMKLK